MLRLLKLLRCSPRDRVKARESLIKQTIKVARKEAIKAIKSRRDTEGEPLDPVDPAQQIDPVEPKLTEAEAEPEPEAEIEAPTETESMPPAIPVTSVTQVPLFLFGIFLAVWLDSRNRSIHCSYLPQYHILLPIIPISNSNIANIRAANQRANQKLKQACFVRSLRGHIGFLPSLLGTSFLGQTQDCTGE